MIVYSEPKSRFQQDVVTSRIADRITKLLREKARRSVSPAEVRSWQNSMQYVRNVLEDDDIPADARVSIEYAIPQTSKRIDVIVSGQDEARRDAAIIIELKQWETARKTSMDAIVSTFVGGAERNVEHPSYQAWTYAALLQDFNETVRAEDVQLLPCAYLHNYTSSEGVLDPFYSSHLEKAPAFLRNDFDRLRAFIKRYVRYGDSRDLMFQIDRGRIRPSKSLADALASMLGGNKEFLLIDDQKVVYETVLASAHEGRSGPKRVVIVEGGPGTGKSVVAINLLVELTSRELLVQYVSRNAAPRAVYESKLAGTLKKTRIANLFRGSWGFVDAERDSFDALIVDEAHRLNEKSGLYGNLGDNQIKELISAARLAVFFIDEDQRVTLRDVGTKEEIKRWAEALGAETTELALASQFRCNGSDGYLGWLDHALQVRPTANVDLEGIDYRFEVLDSPSMLRDRIFELNRESNKARIVAGYCWDWKSKKDSRAFDIEFAGTGFRMRWNLDSDGSLWIVMPESVKEVGCIHTCQGLELDYVGVIIGPDLVVRGGAVVTDASKRARQDQSVKGLKKLRAESPERAKELSDLVIKNTYRTLMTRGQKGCFVYCTDPETAEYFRSFTRSAGRDASKAGRRLEGLPLEVLARDEARPYVNCVPLYDLRVAAGGFSEPHAIDDCEWVALPDAFVPKKGFFVAQVVGQSMNRRIPSGSWCLFRTDPGGSRNGKIVLVQHRKIEDPDLVGGLTIKRYESEREEHDDGTWRHRRIVLKPDSTLEGFRDIVLDPEEAEELVVVGELVAVIC
jgi:hypothetical protein